MRRLVVFLAILAALPLLAASPPDDPPPLIARIAISPATIAAGDTSDHVDLQRGKVVQLVATPYDYNGKPIVGLPIRWSSSGMLTAMVMPNGRVVGVSEGTALISATIRDHVASIRACVAKNSWDVVPTEIISRIDLLPPKLPLLRAGQATKVASLVQKSPINSAWPPECLHWTLSPEFSDSGIVLVNRRGLVRVPAGAKHFTVAATIGMTRPFWQ